MRQENESGKTRRYKRDRREFDIVVAGAGPAGFCAAVAAARLGMRTALVTDRPVIGGNASSEIQIGISGADQQPWNRYAQESGVVEEFSNRMSHSALRSGAWRWSNASLTYFDMVESEPNLSLILNALVHEASLDKSGRIEWIGALQQRSEKELELAADWFIDCTGDGVVGYLAGADYRLGREARGEFGEPSAPLTADRKTMGSTLNFHSSTRDRPVPYKAPAGAIDVSSLTEFPYFGKAWSRSPSGEFGLLWWAEISGLINPIDDDEEVSRRCRMLIYGLWDYIKNSGKFQDVDRLELDWLSPLPGKRESRRLMGPVILTENTLRRQERFADAIGHGGYMIDVHPEDGYLSPDWSSAHNYAPGVYDIPLRSLFSRNVPNLFFAGRDISVTHQALGSLRVEGTCGVTGEAAGIAAAFCKTLGCQPSEAADEHASGLQRLLLRNDQSIIGRTLIEAEDLSRTATARASTERGFELDEADGDCWLPLDTHVGLVLPVRTEKVDFIELLAQGEPGQQLVVDFHGCDAPENYRLEHLLTTVEAAIPGSGYDWMRIPCAARPGGGLKLFAVCRPLKGARLRAASYGLTGAMGIAMPAGTSKPAFDTPYKVVSTPCFKIGPKQKLFAAGNVKDGHIRPYGLPRLWVSDAFVSGRPEWIEHELEKASLVGHVELVFNTDLNKNHGITSCPSPRLIRDYMVEIKTDSGWRAVAEERENALRFRQHDFAPALATAVRLTARGSWGGKYAEVFDFRVYEGPVYQ